MTVYEIIYCLSHAVRCVTTIPSSTLTKGHLCPTCDTVKGKEFIKRLKRNGVEIIEGRGKGGHVWAIHNGRKTTVPCHGSADVDPNFLKLICKQLGLDPDDVL